MAVAWLKNLKQKKFGRPIFTSLLLFLLIFPFPLSLRADFYQSKLFSASFSLRLRGELDHNFNIRSYGSGASDNFLLSRARLEFTLTPISFLSFHVQIQDAEVLGSRFSDADFSGKNNPYHDPFDLNRLYLDFQPNQAFFLRAGRQSISLGDNRVFGPGEWGNTGRYAWDALLARLRLNNLETTIIFGRPVNHDPDRWPNRKAAAPTAIAIYNTLQLAAVDFDFFYLRKYDGRGQVQGESGPGNLNSQAFGFRAAGRSGPWDYSFLGAFEFGRHGADKIWAYGLVVVAGYTFNFPWKPHFSLQYVVGSGDSDPEDGRHETFDGLFSGADTVLYGWMNLFFWKNLREYRVETILQPGQNLTLRAEYHYFTLNRGRDGWYFPGNLARRDLSGSSGISLGHEVDLTARQKAGRHLEFLGGFCFFLPGEFIRQTGTSPSASWTFLQALVSF